MSRYEISRIENDFTVDANPDKEVWADIEPLVVARYAWRGSADPAVPVTTVKMAYTGERLYLLFLVRENFIRGQFTNPNESVCQDSCAEFFAAPSDKGYFNFEINCIGTMLLFYGSDRHHREVIDGAWAEQVEIASSVPKGIRIADSQPAPENGWIIEYSIPFALVSEYSGEPTPAAGTIWRANLYKCGDKTPEPHWGSWAPIDLPKPDFHCPQFFGELVFWGGEEKGDA